MQDKLLEMLLVVRPTSGNGVIPLQELDYILPALGYDFLVDKADDIAAQLDQSGSGCFHQDDLVEYLLQNYTPRYTNSTNLREALKTFDYDNDGRIPYEEFEYFMRNFGVSEDGYMDEERIGLLLECGKPLDQQGQIVIDTLVKNITGCWERLKITKK